MAARSTRSEQALLRAIEDLGKTKLKWALVGGFAVSARSTPRFTEDVDFAVAAAGDDEAEAATWVMNGLGYPVAETIEERATGLLATVRLKSPAEPNVRIDLLFRVTGIDDEIVRAATFLTLLPGVRVRVARTGHLLAMKVLSMDDVRRPQDRSDLYRLLSSAKPADLALAKRSLRKIQRLRRPPRDLLSAYEEILEAHRSLSAPPRRR